MIDLLKAKLPQAVQVGGGYFKIHTDFRYFLILQEKLEDKTTPINGFDFMYIGEVPPSRLEGIRALIEFMNPKSELPRRTGDEISEAVLDYHIDADYIYAAFMEQYGIDLSEAPLHWYKFQSLLRGLHDTKLNTIIGYRLWRNETGKNDRYTKSQEKLKEAWRLPQKEDEEADEALKAFEAQIKR
jgi:hypothetical protein